MTDAQDPGAARAEVARFSARLRRDDLAIGTGGNISLRAGDLVAVTPSGLSYDRLEPADVCLVGQDGSRLAGAHRPSSETPMHLAIYAATGARAIVHTHSPEIIALSAGRAELPAIHYAITTLGGPVRVAPYARFGSAELAAGAVAGLDRRQAVILRSHGAVCYGATLAQAYERALLLEWLARTYRLSRGYGEPITLTEAELTEVAAEMTRLRYGQEQDGEDQ